MSSSIRVFGRKNSGINITGFDVQSGNHLFCHCFAFFLVDASQYKRTLSDEQFPLMPSYVGVTAVCDDLKITCMRPSTGTPGRGGGPAQDV